jgi:hypothetical protein
MRQESSTVNTPSAMLSRIVPRHIEEIEAPSARSGSSVEPEGLSIARMRGWSDELNRCIGLSVSQALKGPWF